MIQGHLFDKLSSARHLRAHEQAYMTIKIPSGPVATHEGIASSYLTAILIQEILRRSDSDGWLSHDN